MAIHSQAPSAFSPISAFSSARAGGTTSHLTRIYIASRNAKEPGYRSEVERDHEAVWPWHEFGQAITLPSLQMHSDYEQFDVDQLALSVHVSPVRWDHTIQVDSVDVLRSRLRAAMDCSLAIVSHIAGRVDWVYAPRATMTGPPEAGYEPLSMMRRDADRREVVSVRWLVTPPGQVVMRRDPPPAPPIQDW